MTALLWMLLRSVLGSLAGSALQGLAESFTSPTCPSPFVASSWVCGHWGALSGCGAALLLEIGIRAQGGASSAVEVEARSRVEDAPSDGGRPEVLPAETNVRGRTEEEIAEDARRGDGSG